MSYNINQVNGESSQGQIDEAKRQANAAIDVSVKQEAVQKEAALKYEGQKQEHARDEAVYDEETRKENAETNQADVAIEMATAGMPAGIEMAKTAASVITDSRQSDPAHLDNSKLEKMTGGTVKSANTFESMFKSFMGDESSGASLMERVEIQSGFTAANKDEAPKGMAVPPDAIDTQYVTSLTMNLGQKQHYEATLANAQRAEQQLSARQNPSLGMGGPAMSLANGPKAPTRMTDEEIATA